MRVLGAVAVMAALCVAPASAGEMDASQLAKELVGTALVWHATDGQLGGELFLHENGKAELKVSLPWQTTDEGRWSLAGNQLCTEWNRLRNSAAKCYTITRLDDGRYQTSGGNIFEIVTVGV